MGALRYVEYTTEQKGVYSFEFARLLLLTCAEIEVALKVACREFAAVECPETITQLGHVLRRKYNVQAEAVRLDRFSETLQPFESWTADAAPDWWSAHNKVKHERHEFFQLATLGHTVSALAGLFVSNLILLNEYGLISHVMERPIVLGRDREPGNFSLESGYTVEMLNGRADR